MSIRVSSNSGRSSFKNKLLALLIACLVQGSLEAQVMITEFLALNIDGIADEEGDRSDWIELHNPGPLPISLLGHRLTDDPGDPVKWIFPEYSLGSGEYLIVFASGKNRRDPTNILHANFSIRADGEYLALISPGGVVIQAYNPSFPPQHPDIAFGRPMGSGSAAYLFPVTPGSDNPDSGFAGVMEPVTFSEANGYTDRPLNLELSSTHPDAYVRFTTDGSVPSLIRSQMYHEPIAIHATTVIRAQALRDGYIPSRVTSRTFIVAGDVKFQADMSPKVVEDPAITNLNAELQSLPVMALSLNENTFFGPQGIYTDFLNRGRDAEVPVAVEYFDPANPDDHFEVDAGIRVHGGQARFHEKKPLRLHFRSEYGTSRLNHPLFEGSAVTVFDQLLLRGGGHDGWAIDWGFGINSLTFSASYMRDQFMRNAELDMGLLSPRGKFVQLFINGQYRGMYNLHERASEDFYSEHLGGDEDDWDVISRGVAAHGDLDDWSEMQVLANQGISTAARYAEIQEFLDIPSFVDAMTSRIWSGDHDWLGPTFINGRQVTGDYNNNWFAARRSRNFDGPKPFLFHSWDAEISMGNNRFSNRSNFDPSFDLSQVNSSNSAGAPYDALRRYSEFRIAFADQLFKHLGPDGALSVAANQDRLDQLADVIRPALSAESARWGNIHGGTPVTRDREWANVYDWLRNDYFPVRNDIVRQQFIERDLYPAMEPPLSSLPAGRYIDQQSLSLMLSTNHPAGTIYYTLDGSDPRRAAQVARTTLFGDANKVQVLVPTIANGGNLLGDSWKQLVAPTNIPAWQTGGSGVGYEQSGSDYQSFLDIDLGTEMYNRHPSAFIRAPFFLSPSTALTQLELHMRYDDGFIAYINGVEVARRNVPANPTWDSSAASDHVDSAARAFERIDISQHIPVVQTSLNMLAIHGMNIATNSSDFLIMPRLVALGAEQPAGIATTAASYTNLIALSNSSHLATRFLGTNGTWSPLAAYDYEVGHPKASASNLAITEIHYHPESSITPQERALGVNDDDYAFIEIQNTSNDTIDLSQLAFIEGVTFNFAQGSMQELGPREHALVVKHLLAFHTRFDTIPLDRVAGVFAEDSSLAKSGETITLQGANEQVIHSFQYNDKAPWPELPDGNGFSLVLRDPDLQPDHTQAENWRASRLLRGSPAADDRDRDQDGLDDDWEIRFFGNLDQDGDADADQDNLSNLRELNLGTHPLKADTDGDLISDIQEVDGLGLNPVSADTDGDTLNDLEELNMGLDPRSADTDDDGIPDGIELLQGTRPDLVDSDADGFSDYLEGQRGTDPKDPSQIPVSQISDLQVYSTFDLSDIIPPLVLNLASQANGTLSGPVEVLPDAGITGEFIHLMEGSPPAIIDYGPTGAPGLGSMSILLWININTAPGTRTIVSKGAAETNRPGWKVFIEDSDLVVRVATDTGEIFEARYPNLQMAMGHHLAFVINNDSGGIHAYLNGLPDGWDHSQANMPRWSLVATPAPLRIGANADGAEPCTGLLDEFMIWNFPLSAQEILRIHQGGVASMSGMDSSGVNRDSDFDGMNDTDELQRFGNLDAGADEDPDADGLTNLQEIQLGSNPLLKDSDQDLVDDELEAIQGSDPNQMTSTNRIDSLADGLLLYSSMDDIDVTSLDSFGLVFDQQSTDTFGELNGSFSHIPGAFREGLRSAGGSISYGDKHDPGTNGYTVSLWIRPEGLDPERTQWIAGKGLLDEEEQPLGWNIVLFGKQFGSFGGATDGSDWLIRNDQPPNGTEAIVGKWAHLLLSIDRTRETVELYVNGQLLGDAALEARADITSDRSLLLGRMEADQPGPNDFEGGVDEFAIWRRVLGQDEREVLIRSQVVDQDLASFTGPGGDPMLGLGLSQGLSVVFEPDEELETSLSITNTGTGPLFWVADPNPDPPIGLGTALANLNRGASQLTSLIPDRFAFFEGRDNNFIQTGGNDMFDFGNILNTDHGQAISYSENRVQASASFGPKGRYFTRKLSGLFVLAADLDQVNRFEVTGNLGADGAGQVAGTVFETTRGSRRFTAYSKRVYGAFDPLANATDPSVNHLIIFESDDEVSRTFSPNTDNDLHRVEGLGRVTRLYYLLFASKDGGFVDDTETQAILDTFMDTIGAKANWLNVGGPPFGILNPDEQVTLPIRFLAADSPTGQTLERHLSIYSNDPSRTQVDIPFSMYVNSPPIFNQSIFITAMEDTVIMRSLAGIVTDPEDPVERLRWHFERDPEDTLIQTILFDPVTYDLTLTLQPNATGFTTLSPVVTDTAGLSSTGSILLLISGTPDPMQTGELFDHVASQTETGIVYRIGDTIFDPDFGDIMTYTLTRNSKPDLFAQLDLNPTTGQLAIRYKPFVSGRADLTIHSQSSGGEMDTQTFTVTVTQAPTAPLTILSAFTNSTLREQHLTIMNDAPYDLHTLELDIPPLLDADRAVNASVQNPDGSATVFYYAPIAAGSSVEIILAYRSMSANPAISIRTSPRGYAPNHGPFELGPIQTRDDRTTDFSFPSFIGKAHQVQYQDDFGPWRDAVRLPPAGTQIYWRDDGPPLTHEHPSKVRKRIYRVKSE